MEEPTPIVLAWSGGKDSSMALLHLRSDPRCRVVALLTTITGAFNRISMHGVRRELLTAQARSLGLPLIEAVIPWPCDNETYNAAMTRALGEVRRQGARHVAFGDLFLQDVRAYRESQMAAAGMSALFPVWGQDTRRFADRFIALGFECTLTCIDTEQLDGRFAGRRFDDALLAELPASCDPCGENGEFHSFVHGGPIFTEPIGFTLGQQTLRDGRFMYQDLLQPAEAGAFETTDQGDKHR